MHVLAVIVGSLGTGYAAYSIGSLFYPHSIVIALLLMIACGFYIAQGGEMAWVRSWGTLATAALLGAVPCVYIGISLKTLKAQSIGDSFGLAIVEAMFEITGGILFSFGILFLVLAIWQYRRVKKGNLSKGAE